MDNNLPPMVECPYCSLPIPIDTTEYPYCNRKCFDAHVDMALHKGQVERVMEKIHRVSNNAGKHPVFPENHHPRCSCYKC